MCEDLSRSAAVLQPSELHSAACLFAGAAKLRWQAYPDQVTALAGVKVRSIAAGAFHSGAVDDDGNAWLWGNGGSWQLGTGANVHECVPQQVSAALRCVVRLCFTPCALFVTRGESYWLARHDALRRTQLQGA
jgi:hypothetical protein